MATGEYLLKFVADASQPLLVMDQIKAKAKETQAEIIASSANGATPIQRVNALANERGRVSGDITSAQNAGILSGTQAKNLRSTVFRDFDKGLKQILAESGLVAGTPAHTELKKAFSDTSRAATIRRVKENAPAVSAYKEEQGKKQSQEKQAKQQADQADADAAKKEKEKAARAKARAKKAEDSAKEEAKTDTSGSDKKKAKENFKTVSPGEVYGSPSDGPLGPKEAAAQAVKDRETAVKFGAEKQAAYLKQLREDPAFAGQLVSERFDRQSRLAIEDGNYNKKVREDNATSPKGESLISKRAQSDADEAANQSALNAEVKRRLAEDKLYIDSEKEGALAQAELTAAKQESLVAEREYVQNKVRAAVADAQSAASVEAGLANSAEYITAKIKSAKAHAQEAEFISAGKAVSDEYIASIVETTVTNQKITAKQNAILAAHEEYQASLVESAVVEKSAAAKRKAAISGKLLADPEYRKANAETRVNADKSKVADIEAFRSAGGVAASVAAKAEQTLLDQEINAGKWLELSTNEAAIKTKAEAIIAEKAYKDAVEAQVFLMTGGGGRKFLGGLLGGGGRRGGGGGGLTGDESAGQFFGAGLRSTIRHAVPSLLLFAVGAEIVKTIKQASELERVFNQIEAQFKSVDDAASFPNFKKNILEISKATGVASDTLATIAFQYKGAFGAKGNDYVLRQTESAAQISKVTGLNPNEVVDSVQAASISFGVDAQELGNVALNIQDRYGVLAKETIKFLGDVAPAAQDAGFSLEEISTLAGIAQQRSGRAGSAIAESFNRIFPAMREAKTQLLELATSNDVLKSPEFIKDLVSGDVSKQFIFLAQNFDKLDERAQGFLIKLLGGRREAQAIIPIFAAGNLEGQIKDTKGASKKTLEDRFKKLQETLEQRIAQLSEAFKQFGVQLFESGLGDFLKDLIGMGKIFVDIFAGVARIFNVVNKATGGLAGHIVSIYLALRLLTAIKGTALISGLGQLLLGSGSGAYAGARTGGAGILSSAGTGGLAALLNSKAGKAFIAARVGGAGNLSALGSGASAAIMSPTGFAIGAALAYTARQNQHAEADAVAAEYSKMKQADLQKTFDSESNKSKTNIGSVSRFLSGDSQDSTLAQDELQKRDAKDVGIAQSKFLRKNLTKEQKATISGQLDNKFLRGISLDELLKAYEKDPSSDKLNAAFNEAVYKSFDLQGTNALTSSQRTGLAAPGGKKIKDEKIQDIINKADTKYQDYDQLKASYQTNQISLSNIKGNLDARIKLLKDSLAKYPGDLDLKAELAKYVKERYDILGQALDTKFELDTKLIDAFGGTDKSKALQKIALLQQRLKTPGLDPSRRKQTAEDITASYNDYLQQRLKAADLTPQELNVLSKDGIKIPKEAKDALVTAQLDPNSNLKYGQVLDQFKGNETSGSQSELQNLIKAAITGDKGTKKWVVAVLKKKAEDAKLLVELLAGTGDSKAYKKALDNLNALNTAIGELVSGENFGVKSADAVKANQDQVDEANRQLLDAKNGYLKALSPGNSVLAAQLDKNAAHDRVLKAKEGTKEWYDAAKDEAAADKAMLDAKEAIDSARDSYAKALAAGQPLAIANIDYSSALRKYNTALSSGDVAGQESAKADMVNAQNARRDYYINLADAQADFDLSLVENDPIQVAQSSIAAASRAFANARNEVDKLKAEAAKIRANRQLQQAQHDIVTAQIELMKAWADYSGDTVKSSQLALKEAKDNLAYLQKTGAGEAQIKQAQAQVVGAQAQVRDSNLQDKLDTYQFLYDMDKISKGQLIQYLQSLLKIPNLTKRQVEDIQRQIKGLRDSLGDSFNVPSELNLPTLYEIARIDQLNGSSYQSSRGINGVNGPRINNNNQQYNITINANGVSVQQALTVIKDAVTSPARTGNDARIY